MHNKDVIYAKLENLRHCLVRIETKKPESLLELIDNYDLQDIITINLERAIQCCVDIATHIIAESDSRIPESMGKVFIILEELHYIDSQISKSMLAAVGFRNIAVHAYRDIDWSIVFSIITEHLADFKQFTTQILQKIED